MRVQLNRVYNRRAESSATAIPVRRYGEGQFLRSGSSPRNRNAVARRADLVSPMNQHAKDDECAHCNCHDEPCSFEGSSGRIGRLSITAGAGNDIVDSRMSGILSTAVIGMKFLASA